MSVAPREGFRLRLYRWFMRSLVWPAAQGLVGGLRRTAKARGESVDRLRRMAAPGPGARRVWFHAASVGELESIRPVLERARAEGWEAVVTGFSPSLESALRRLEEGGSAPGRLRHSGFSPGEGSWGSALDGARPHAIVTAKYEAWPELWAAAAARGIPIVIVGARPRGSLATVKRALRWLGSGLPRLELLAFDENDLAALRALFPGAAVVRVGDPRWDRAAERARRGSARVDELARRYGALPRPWGMVGSAWPADLRRLGWAWGDGRGVGTLWVAPHRVDEAGLREIEGALAELGLQASRTSGPLARVPEGRRACVLVNEMGFLSELYRVADWAFVGGGFGAGVHSTIEPAVHGLPVAAGPSRAETFAEVRALARLGQLSLVRDGRELAAWVNARVKDSPGGAAKRFDVSGLLGGTEAVWARLRGVVPGGGA
ncbi:MAG: hypothetical protein IT285_05180 [Bdellovibrionales bacterium]|nr:hypothetical protein [Bdellovibrionales bacterium]